MELKIKQLREKAGLSQKALAGSLTVIKTSMA